MLQVAPTLEGSGNQLSTSLRSYYDRHRKLDLDLEALIVCHSTSWKAEVSAPVVSKQVVFTGVPSWVCSITKKMRKTWRVTVLLCGFSVVIKRAVALTLNTWDFLCVAQLSHWNIVDLTELVEGRGIVRLTCVGDQWAPGVLHQDDSPVARQTRRASSSIGENWRASFDRKSRMENPVWSN